MRPPHIETYCKESDYVFVSIFHSEQERTENIRLASFLGEKMGDVVYLLPHIQPTQKEASKLRNEFFPKGVKDNKNPDFYFRGRFVDGKSMLETSPKDRKVTKRIIQNRLRKAFFQAEDALLEIPTTFPRGWVEGAIRGKQKSSNNHHVIYVKYGDEMLVFNG